MTAAAKKVVSGVVLAKVEPKVLDQFLGELGLEQAGTLEQKVARMVSHQRQVASAEGHQIADCNTCGGEASVKLVRCPYCGDGEWEGGEPPAGVEPIVDDMGPTEEDEPKPEEPPGGKLVRMRRSKAAPAEAEPARGRKPPMALAAMPIVEDLDQAVERVRQLKRNAVLNYHQIGHELLDIYDRKLYLQRRDKAGRPLYSGWRAFIQAEIGINARYSYELMGVAKFFSREQVNELGTTKLGLVLRVPEEQRQQLLEAARKGVTRSELAIEVERVMGRDGGGERARDQGAGAAKPAAGGAKAPKGITVILQVGRMKVPLMARPKKKGDERQAKRLADDPSCEIEHDNGTVQIFRVVQSKKGLELIIETRPNK